MADGAKVSIGGKEYAVPAATCWVARQVAFSGREAEARGAREDEWLDILCEQIRIVLEPNYPDLDVPALQKVIHLGELAGLHRQVMLAAGVISGGQSGEARSP